MSEKTYHLRNKETKSNRAREYYEINTEVLREKARNK